MATKLKDDETYMVPYDKLSRGDKQARDLALRKTTKEEADAADNARTRDSINNTIGGISKLITGRDQPYSDSEAAPRKRAADAEAARFTTPSGLVGASSPQKLKRGGTVKKTSSVKKPAQKRGWGIARRG